METPLDVEVKKAVMDLFIRFRREGLSWELVRALVLGAVTIAVSVPDATEDEVHALIRDAWPKAAKAVRDAKKRLLT